MRLIDADRFKDNILSGLYIFCQENKEDIARAIDDEPTINLTVPINMKNLTAEEKETLIKGFARRGEEMFNIASYQEGYTDGHKDGKDDAKELLRRFIAEQHIEDPDRPHERGYNSALKDLSEFIEEYL